MKLSVIMLEIFNFTRKEKQGNSKHNEISTAMS